MSLDVSAGSFTFASGILTPFLSESSPLFTATICTFFSSLSTILNSTSPSSIKTLPPTTTSFEISLYETETLVSSPSTSSVVSVNFCPWLIYILPFLKVPILISGPFVSSIIATGTFSFSRTFFILSIRRACSSCVP